MNNYKNTFNFELVKYYNCHWDNDTLDRYRERVEKYYNRINKYINKYKSKNLIFKDGCYNMNVLNVTLTDMYELVVKLGDNKTATYSLDEFIDDNRQLRYDSKYHIITIYMY